MLIDIKKNYRQYSPEELRELAYKDLLTCGTVELSGFLEYIFTGYGDEAYAKGFKDGEEEASGMGYYEGYEAGRDDYQHCGEE